MWGSKRPTPGKLCESTWWWVSGSGLCVTSCTRAMWNIVQFNQERCDWVYYMTQLKCSQHLVLKDICIWLLDDTIHKCSEWNWKTYRYHGCGDSSAILAVYDCKESSGNYACIYMSDKNAFICHQDLKRHIYVE